MSNPEPSELTVEVTMPEIGGELAQVVAWLKRPGESVQADEPLCTVAWGAQRAEVSSPATGVVRLHCVSRGASVVPGDSLSLIDTATEGVATSRDRGTLPVAINTSPPQLEEIQT